MKPFPPMLGTVGCTEASELKDDVEDDIEKFSFVERRQALYFAVSSVIYKQYLESNLRRHFVYKTVLPFLQFFSCVGSWE